MNALDYDKIALKLVTSAVDEAFDAHTKNVLKENEHEDTLFRLKEEESLEKTNLILFKENEDNFQIKNIVWPRIEEFNTKLGEAKIDEFIKSTWEYEKCWLYCIDLIEKVDKDFTTLYHYRVQWTIPTRRKPIPRFTACVYFTYDVSKIKPKNTSVNVYYVFETQRVIHQPGKSRFREQWLNDIKSFKEALIDNFKF